MLGIMNARFLLLPVLLVPVLASPCAAGEPSASAPAATAPVASAPAAKAPATSAPAASAPAPAPLPREVDAAQAAALLRERPDIVVLDVRSPEEFRMGHLAGATLIDHDGPGFADKLLALDRSRTYLVYCKAGGRSADARDILVGKGRFPSVVYFGGGFDAWLEAGLPFVTE